MRCKKNLFIFLGFFSFPLHAYAQVGDRNNCFFTKNNDYICGRITDSQKNGSLKSGESVKRLPTATNNPVFIPEGNVPPPAIGNFPAPIANTRPPEGCQEVYNNEVLGYSGSTKATSVRSGESINKFQVTDVGNGQKAIQVNYEKGKPALTSTIKRSLPGGPYRAGYMEYQWRVSENFSYDFNKGTGPGCSTNPYTKKTNTYGKHTGIWPSNEYMGGGGNQNGSRWSSRVSPGGYRNNDAKAKGATYDYWPNSSKNCQANGKCYGKMAFGSDYALPKTKWATIKHEVVMNDPGSSNGYVNLYVDGVLVASGKNRMWTTTEDAWIKQIGISHMWGGTEECMRPLNNQQEWYRDFKFVACD